MSNVNWIMSHVWTSHISHVNWIMSHVWKSRMTHAWMSHVPRMNLVTFDVWTPPGIWTLSTLPKFLGFSCQKKNSRFLLQKRPTKMQRNTTQIWQLWFESFSTRGIEWYDSIHACHLLVGLFGIVVGLFYKRELTIYLERGTLNIWTPQGTCHGILVQGGEEPFLEVQVNFRKRATNYRALSRKMTYKDKASYGSSPPCNTETDTVCRIPSVLRIFCESALHEYKRALQHCDTLNCHTHTCLKVHGAYVTQWWRKNRRLHKFLAHFFKRALQKWGTDLPKCNAHEISHTIHPWTHELKTKCRLSKNLCLFCNRALRMCDMYESGYVIISLSLSLFLSCSLSLSLFLSLSSCSVPLQMKPKRSFSLSVSFSLPLSPSSLSSRTFEIAVETASLSLSLPPFPFVPFQI